ncbi:MAG: hypothetical protein AABZ39_12200 [Spirochaetota bacterium]
MSTFQRYIGIDYSGAKTSDDRLPGIQAYMATGNSAPEHINIHPRQHNWTRRELAEWLIDSLNSSDTPAIVGIDHGFSFPISYMRERRLTAWNAFLLRFEKLWPLRNAGVCVDDIRFGKHPPPLGKRDALRITEKWTSSAKSVFCFDARGSVAKSTLTGLSWLIDIRRRLKKNVFIWPYDGWLPPRGAHVIAEAYPSIFKRRYIYVTGNEHARDAFVTARWLQDMDHRNALQQYFQPFLTDEEKSTASIEGWILGVL